MNTTRRVFLHRAVLGGASMAVLSTGLLRSAEVLAAWPAEAFEAETLDDTLQALFDGEKAEDSISILVENNPSPLAAKFNLTPDVVPDVSTRIKMGETSNVIALVKADGKLFMANQEVKVTIGGCGG